MKYTVYVTKDIISDVKLRYVNDVNGIVFELTHEWQPQIFSSHRLNMFSNLSE